MPKSLKIITIIGVLCMLVPFLVLGLFASAETMQDGDFVYEYYNFRSIRGVGVDQSTVYSFFTDNQYFNYNTVNPNFDGAFSSLPETDYDLNLNGADISIKGLNSVFRPAFYTNSMSANGRMNITWDSANGKLHSYFLSVVVANVSLLPFQVDLEDCFLFNGVTLYNHGCSSVKLTDSYSEDDGTYISGSNSSVEGLMNPSFTFNAFVNDTFDFSSDYEFYALTWYGLPTEGNTLSPNYSVYPMNLFVISFVDMSYEALGFSQGYDDGFDDGFTDGYEDGLAEGFDEGYDSGVTAGRQQANNTVTQNSASYLQGYQDGLNAPEYSFMSLIASVFDAPIRALFGYTQDGVQHPGLFSIDILGMNMGAFIASIFSLAVILTVLRLVLGGKS